MDMNWYMKKMLATEHQHDLLISAEQHRLRREARRPHWLRPRPAAGLATVRAAEPMTARRQVVVPCTPTWHS
jgi:hypothetical protein